MNNAKHTPGPWRSTKGARDTVHIGPDVRNDAGRIVAFVSYDGAPVGDGAEADANARLIAAAPAMLEALRIALENAWVISDHDCAMPRVDFDALLAAFTQAGGELT